jgi:uncharacterized YccA/Bax inhibitor family protein
MKSTNPVLNAKALEQFGRPGQIQSGEAMTVEGAINKTAFLTFLLVVPAAWVWSLVAHGGVEAVTPWMIGGLFGGFIAAMVTVFKKEWAPATAPIYAALEGLAIGGLSALLEARYHGIVLQAVALTFATLATMLVAYRTGLIKVTDKFRMVVVAATGAIALLYLVTMILSLFHVTVPFVFGGGGTFGIVLSLVVIVVAALNLALGFDFIEQAAGAGAPKYVEWYAAFGLMVTLVWLYLEMIRLLSRWGSGRRKMSAFITWPALRCRPFALRVEWWVASRDRTTTALLLALYDQAFDARAWHGTPLAGALRGVSVVEARWRPRRGRHNIWEIVLHTAYWKYIVRRRLTRDVAARFAREGSNWFSVPPQPDVRSWKQDLALLREQHGCYDAIARFPLARLPPAPGAQWTNAATIYGIASHDLIMRGRSSC